MKVNLQKVTPDAELNLVEIARVSSSRKDKTEESEKLINYLIKNRHWSPFEHSYMTVEIETSKAIGIQLLRHRSFTFQEFSQRYAKVTEFEPIQLRRQAKKNRQSSEEEFDPYFHSGIGEVPASQVVDELLGQIDQVYRDLISAGVAKECARFILPMTTRTTLFMTGNIRSWIHFLQIRDDEHAQLECQLIAREIKQLFCEHFPITATALEWKKIGE